MGEKVFSLWWHLDSKYMAAWPINKSKQEHPLFLVLFALVRAGNHLQILVHFALLIIFSHSPSCKA